MTESMRAGGSIGRRGLILGVGTGSVLAGGLTMPALASSGSDGVSAAEPRAGGSPITTTLAGATTRGVSYKSVMMYDFEPFDPNAKKTWGGSGTYSAGTASSMRATIDIPPGAQVQQVEYYIYNNTGNPFYPDTYLWVPGQGTISSIGASVPVPTGTSLTATAVTPTQQGPYPDGSRLLVSASTPSTGLVQINGARVGFRQGGGTEGVLQKPLGVLGHTLKKGKIYNVALPSQLIAPGLTGVQLNVVAQGAKKAGSVRLWSHGEPRPKVPTMFFSGSGGGVASALVVPVSKAGTFNVQATSAVHLDITALGTVS